MKQLAILTSLLALVVTSLYSQNPGAEFDGKITIGNDTIPAEEGAIRYDSTTGKFEGYDGKNWIALGQNCVCPYVVKPFNDQPHFGDFQFVGNKLQITVEFSHQMDPGSFIYGTNLIIRGSALISTSGTLNWSNGNTQLVITTDEDWFALTPDCVSGFDFWMYGTGELPIKSVNGGNLDGDRDGCCGGDFYIHLETLC